MIDITTIDPRTENQARVFDSFDSGNNLLYCVPYHPETNPIEEFFSQLKHYIRKESPQDYKEINDKIKDILKTKIKKKHLENYFKHSFKIYK